MLPLTICVCFWYLCSVRFILYWTPSPVRKVVLTTKLGSNRTEPLWDRQAALCFFTLFIVIIFFTRFLLRLFSWHFWTYHLFFTGTLSLADNNKKYKFDKQTTGTWMFSLLAHKFFLRFLFKQDYKKGWHNFVFQNVLAPRIYNVLYAAAYINNPMNGLIMTGGPSRGETFLPSL